MILLENSSCFGKNCGVLGFFLQVTSLLRRVLPEVTPSRLASIIGVKSLPPADISDIIHSTEKGDWNKLGILDMFLGCIAKALTVQLKAKGTTITGTAGTTAGKGVTTVTLPMIFNSRFVSKYVTNYYNLLYAEYVHYFSVLDSDKC